MEVINKSSDCAMFFFIGFFRGFMKLKLTIFKTFMHEGPGAYKDFKTLFHTSTITNKITLGYDTTKVLYLKNPEEECLSNYTDGKKLSKFRTD